MDESEEKIERFGTHPWAYKAPKEPDAEMIVHLRNVLQTESGRAVLGYVRDLCRPDESVVEVNELGDPNIHLTMRNAGLQTLWNRLKMLMYLASREHLILIELPPIKEI